MKLLITIILFNLAGCAIKPPRVKPIKKVGKSRISRRTECVMRFIGRDVKPATASNICTQIYKR